jgi:hypothetical protein
VETMTAHILTPYPGTDLHKRLQREKRIFDFDPAHYNTSHAVFHPQRMTARELREGYLWIYEQFYSWKNIIRRLPDNPRQRMAYLLFNLVYRKYGKCFSWFATYGFMSQLGQLARRLSYGIE